LVTEIIYTDSLVAITGDSILFKRYSLFERDRLVLFSDIKKIIVKPASIWNGKFRFHGQAISIPGFPRIFKDTNATKFSLRSSATNGGVLDLPSRTQPLS